MMRSMFSGVAGLRAHQTMMDVVGNNIANVNTAGYKASQVTFQEALTQIMRGPAATVNPLQLGLGVKVAAIDPVFTQGASQVTGRATDLAIQGDGFFVVQHGGSGQLFTRAGAFSFDSSGNLTTANGANVMGWVADATGKVDTNTAVTPISIPIGQVLPSKATTVVQIGGNLAADAVVGTTVNKSITVYDSVGSQHNMAVTFTKTGANAWTASGKIDGSTATVTPSALTFGTDGKLTSATTLAVSGFTPAGADPMAFNIDLAKTPLVQFGGGSTIQIISQDGMPIGNLQGVKVSDDGTITGQFSNGLTAVMAQVATATFANPAGLVRIGDSEFTASVASGLALVGAPGTGSRGSLSAGALEMSNVDLAQEFTNMIIAERGFQANSRVITVSDEMLNDLVSIKR